MDTKAKELIITAVEIRDDSSGSEYEYKVYELPCGLLFQLGTDSSDIWWLHREEIEAFGTDRIVSIRTSDSNPVEFDLSFLKASLERSIQEFALPHGEMMAAFLDLPLLDTNVLEQIEEELTRLELDCNCDPYSGLSVEEALNGMVKIFDDWADGYYAASSLLSFLRLQQVYDWVLDGEADNNIWQVLHKFEAKPLSPHEFLVWQTARETGLEVIYA